MTKSSKKPISTLNLKALPDVDDLKKLCQSIALLDAIICPEWEYRYFSFDSKWDNSSMMGSMRNGFGDEVLIFFNKHGAVINGFAHESTMSPFNHKPKRLWPGLIDTLPKEFIPFIKTEPIPSTGTTFCIWKKYDGTTWNIGDIEFPDDEYNDGSAELLFIYDGNPKTYKNWAEDYFDRKFNLMTIKKIYSYNPLTEKMIHDLNTDITFTDLTDDLEKIRYPVSEKNQ